MNKRHGLPTYREVAERFTRNTGLPLTPQGAQQIERRALAKLRKALSLPPSPPARPTPAAGLFGTGEKRGAA